MNIAVRRPDYPSGAAGQSRFFQRPPEAIATLSNSTTTMQGGNPEEALVTSLAYSAQSVLDNESEVPAKEADSEANAGGLEENREAESDRNDVVDIEPVLPLTPMEPTEQELAIVGQTIPLATVGVIQQERAFIEPALPLTPMQLIQRENEVVAPTLPLAPAELTQQELVITEEVLPLTPAEPTRQELELAKRQDLPVMWTPVQPVQQKAAVVEPVPPLTPAEPIQQEIEAKKPIVPEVPVQFPEPGQGVAVIESALPLNPASMELGHDTADNQQKSTQEGQLTRVGQADVHLEKQAVREPVEAPSATEPVTDQPRRTTPNQPEATGNRMHLDWSRGQSRGWIVRHACPLDAVSRHRLDSLNTSPELPKIKVKIVHPRPATQPQPKATERSIFSWASIVASSNAHGQLRRNDRC